MVHGLWNGCQLDIQFDDSIYDIIIHDPANTTFLSLRKNFNGEI
jgi:hypothetical protein